MSSSPSTLPYSEDQRREAAEWFIAIRAENAPKPESIQAWLKWMDQHEGNRAAFDAVARAWHATPTASGLDMPSCGEMQADAYDGDESVAEWLAKQTRASSEPVSRSPARAAHKMLMSRRTWLAAACVLIALSSLVMMNRDWNQQGSRADAFTTRTGEQIEITLPDGSRVWLGPRSELLVSFDAARRGIQLTTGEAFFDVKQDLTRPFTVRSKGGDIVAVGTAFNVKAIDEHVTVAVSEGVVAVTPKTQLATPQPASVRVASGQELTFTAQQSVQALSIVQSPTPGERSRWREGVLVYRNEPLEAVVSDLVRYSSVQIEIADASVGDLQYTGIIYRHAVEEWLMALPESFPVAVVSDGTREIIKAR